MNKSIVSLFVRALGYVAPKGPVALAASRTLTEDDNGATLVYGGAGAATVTVPQGLPAGFTCKIVQNAAGAVTVAAASGVTVVSADTFVKTKGANAVIDLTQVSGVKYNLGGQGAVA